MRGFAESGAFWEALKGEMPELILLDIMLPDEDGISVLKKLRSSPLTKDIPLFAGKIRREAQRLAQLVEEIIDLSLLDSGAGELQRSAAPA